MEKAWMPLAVGIISMIAGVLGVLRRSVMFVGVNLILPALEAMHLDMPAFVAAFAVPALIAGIVFALLAIVGGTYALRRKIWELALTGSIAAVFCSVPLGVVAVVLITLSRKEFAQSG